MQFNKFFVHEINHEKFVLITDAGNWLGVSKKELENIRNNDIGNALSKKLESKKIIITGKNKKQLLGDYRKNFAHLTHGISLHIVNPTMRCNQGCYYCYADSLPLKSKKQTMDLGMAKKTVDFIWQSPKKNIIIEFQGGEPLANFDAIQFIVDYAKQKLPKKNVLWRVVSNFSLMDETIAAYFKKNKVLDLCTSLDGPKKLHDKNRPLDGGSHKKVVYWVDSLRKDFGFEKIGALCTVTKFSLPFAREIVDEYQSLGLPDITPVVLRKIGRAKQNWGKIGYEPMQYVSFWKEMLDYCIELSRSNPKKPMTEQYSLMIMQKLFGKRIYHTCFSKPCGAALMQASYQPDGSIFTCDEGKAEPLFKIGNVEQKYQAVFTSPNALNAISMSSCLGLICNECKWTAFCSFCPVMAYAAQGSPIPLLFENTDCIIRKAQFSHIFEKLFSKDRPVLMKWLSSSYSQRR